MRVENFTLRVLQAIYLRFDTVNITHTHTHTHIHIHIP